MNRLGTTAALLAALLLGAAGCASEGGTAAAERRADDASITAGVKAAVAADERLRTTEIDVDTDQGIVQLSGFVSSAEDVAAAAAAARTVRGVLSVRNDLRLK
ncbi:BON domain-containing protein [Massilia sp. YIM B02763]|uniref:BON domain-containing protein n=1 Tax=Massilia sp. YIM B02763 TaxID=3050130 RepID=UPI0025B663E4|nr:BON domain-containing protein [Massilia sp. YIM B02763]MDN4052221.1 BON domain-containing protein [Massilia sp. YIM B02763]